MAVIIKNVNIVDYKTNCYGDVYVNNGVIEDIGRDLEKTCEIIDGTGKVLMPGFVDLHCHFRDPGYTYKENLETGSRAALAGGVSTVNLMANTNPICSSMEIFYQVMEKGKKLDLVNINQIVSITENMGGKSIEHLDKLTNEVKFISDDGVGVPSDQVMYNAMLKAKEKGITIISHTETREFSKIDMRLAENLMTYRDIGLCEHTGAHLHLAHVSTKEAMRAIMDAKDRGANVTCEVTPHHIALHNCNFRVNPPIREKEDVDFLIEAIKSGYVDCISTDHAPHTKEDKAKGAPGMVGLETSFSICYEKLVKAGHISLSKLSEIMSKNPAEIMNSNCGRIEKGYRADLVLVDLEHDHCIDSQEFLSMGKNTPFNGMKVSARVEKTMVKGIIKYDYKNMNI
ncbi:dihydroorotase [Hathewaya proteolytica DSM 3090]|uniref:Dihydroorotase n=1 Tax=Hathewaya proteolytica DSM 3090 TaxID=1121331 RepID=A0A1M6Q800_9CLOT|nr:dihydroorotase [Hathewaya proteolytica]SHK16213.1 dihydroorotase [Hathewaya proteolytica DSM 3090]